MDLFRTPLGRSKFQQWFIEPLVQVYFDPIDMIEDLKLLGEKLIGVIK